MWAQSSLILAALICVLNFEAAFGWGVISGRVGFPKRVTSAGRSALQSQREASRSTRLWGNPKGRAWAKGDLSDKDIFEDEDAEAVEGGAGKKKDKFKLEPETVFYEGAPSPSELIIPGLSVLTVIGIVPFAAALARQAWVRYKFTSRRISIVSGVGGSTTTEIIYPDIEEIRFVYRFGGNAGDMVLFLKDGAKVEMRFVPNFEETYKYILSKCDEECNKKSRKIEAKN